jgi:hypothetical protein
MRLPLFIACTALMAGSISNAARAVDTGTSSGASFVFGLRNPEDIVRLPGTAWVVASSINFSMSDPSTDIGPGPLSAVRIDTRLVERLYPSDSSRVEWDSKTFPNCSAPPEVFSSHGLNVRVLTDRTYRLYVANHGSRESVEIIDVAVRGTQLSTTWRGCLPVSVKDLRVWPNAVAPLPDGGVVLAGMNVAIWRPGGGWKRFHSYHGITPGSQEAGGIANGVEVSGDGKWLWIADTGRSSVIRVALRGGPQREFKLSFVPDNLRWGEDGQLYVSGPIWPKWKDPDGVTKCFQKPICVTGIGVASIDTLTLKLKDIVHDEIGVKDAFGTPTTALQIDDHLWIGTSRGDRVMIVPLRR